jgi:thymidylate synthase (FAD)
MSDAKDCDDIWTNAMESALECYEALLKKGAPPEQARSVLPLCTETQWYWTGSLSAWARLFNLRVAPNAQREVAQVAKEIGTIVSTLFPLSWKALTSQ